MKKTLTFLSLMGAMASSAVAGTVAIAPAPAPVPAAAPAWESAVALEALCAIAEENGEPNLWGPRFSYCLLNEACEKVVHEVNFGLGLLWGREGNNGSTIREFQMPLSVGYNFNYEICEKTSVYAGAKLALAYTDINERFAFDGEVEKEHDAAWGWQWSVGTGVKYAMTEQTELILGYEFVRDYADFSDFGKMAASYHIINLGVQYNF